MTVSGVASAAGRACLAGLVLIALWAVSAGTPLSPLPEAHAQVSPDKAERGPRFPWPSFMRFWNSRCKEGAEIQNPMFLNNRYVTNYGDSVTLVVEMENEIVKSVSAMYADPTLLEGGQKWIKLVDSVITVGTYRWPRGQINEVRKRFRAISPSPESYIWQNSSFEREQIPGTGWQFKLRFLEVPVFNE